MKRVFARVRLWSYFYFVLRVNMATTTTMTAIASGSYFCVRVPFTNVTVSCTGGDTSASGSRCSKRTTEKSVKEKIKGVEENIKSVKEAMKTVEEEALRVEQLLRNVSNKGLKKMYAELLEDQLKEMGRLRTLQQELAVSHTDLMNGW